MPFNRGSFALFLAQLTLSFGTAMASFAINEAMPTISQMAKDIMENFNEPEEILIRKNPEYFPETTVTSKG